MLNLKKTAVAVLALGSSAVFAGTMGPVCSAVNVTVPCESTSWELGAQALYLSSSLGQQQVTLSTATQSVDAGLNPKYGWGFMIEGGYHFNTGNDLNLNWYHVGNGRSRTGGGQSITTIPGQTGPFTVDSVTVTSTYASVSPKWDAVNLELGQHVDFGENKSIRFHGGFEYARLTGNTNLSATGAAAVTVATIPLTIPLSGSVTTSPTYNGFGPRLGSDLNYDWGNGLGIYANGAFGILAGTAKNSVSLYPAAGPAVITGSTSDTIIVPELEAKLGLSYDYATAQGDLALDVGWMWINYFNVINSNQDYGLQGPFVGLKWMGNVA